MLPSCKDEFKVESLSIVLNGNIVEDFDLSALSLSLKLFISKSLYAIDLFFEALLFIRNPGLLVVALALMMLEEASVLSFLDLSYILLKNFEKSPPWALT
jgi:hypothetical protein